MVGVVKFKVIHVKKAHSASNSKCVAKQYWGDKKSCEFYL